jgi:hypothetical protein
MLVYQVSNLFSTAAAATTLYFIYTALLATYFICLTKFVHPKGIEPPDDVKRKWQSSCWLDSLEN